MEKTAKGVDEMKKSADRGSLLIQTFDRRGNLWQKTRPAANERRSVCSVLDLVDMIPDSMIVKAIGEEVRPP